MAARGAGVDSDGQAAAIPQRELLARTAKGAGWVIAWRFATRFIGFCSTLVLVRLLTPADFGIVTLATGFFQALDAVVGFGVEGAIVRADRTDRAIFDAGFTINVVRGLLTSGVLAAAAVPVARFFHNAHLVGVIYVLAAGWAVSSFENIGMVEFRRTLAFDMEFKAQIIPRLLALAVTLPAAFIYHSYWALVAGIVATRVMTVGLGYILHPYRPRLGVAGMKHIVGFSFWEWMIGLLNLVGGRADTIIIGRVLGAAPVGVYGVGTEIALLPSGEIVAPLCRALFSGFVVERRAGGTGAATLVRVLSILALITFPLNMGLSLEAYPVVKIAFGATWLGAVPLIQLLGLATTINLFSSVGEALFSAHAWLRTILAATAAATALRVALLLVLIPRYGLIGGALAAAAVGIFQEGIYMATAMRRLKIGFWPVLAAVFRPLAGVCAMALVLARLGLGWTTTGGTNAQLGAQLALAVALGAAVYVGVVAGLWLAAGRPEGGEADILEVVRRVLGKVFKRKG